MTMVNRRSSAFLKGASRKLPAGEAADRAMFVVGGFHTAFMTASNGAASGGISYVVFSPTITQAERSKGLRKAALVDSVDTPGFFSGLCRNLAVNTAPLSYGGMNTLFYNRRLVSMAMAPLFVFFLARFPRGDRWLHVAQL